MNDTTTDYPRELLLTDLFEEQVRKSRDRTALVFRDRRWSYGELNDRANAYAQRLMALGIGADVRVGVYLERSAEMVAAVIGVLKAGGAYVPLDPAFPKERLSYMLRDSGAPVLITQPELATSLDSDAQRILSDDPSLGSGKANAPPRSAAAENLAYVIYTSGSTGKPKGVEVPHRALVNFLLSMQREPGLRAEDILLAVTTLSFDIAALELFLPLITGAQVVVVDQDSVSDGQALKHLLHTSGATILQATPATWRLLLDSGWKQAKELKALCGGEALPRELADRILATGAELWNLYGPTETTIWSAVLRVEPGPDTPRIGPPIANTQFYVVDRDLRICPMDAPGELLIGGDGLARGYLNRSELTAEQFVPNPFESDSERLYRTGDLVRRQPDGTLEFLGRLDHQVKIRGFRIELGEVEASLTAHPHVQECVAIVREDVPGDKRLVAYIIPVPGYPVDPNELRRHMSQQLPDYMVPAACVSMDAFPLPPNRKIDRKALPRPHTRDATPGAEFVAPRDDLELKLATIWKKLLGTRRLSVEDSFFDLGGNSLLAAQVFAMTEKTLGRNVPLAILFQAPTIAQLAAVLRAEKGVNWWSALTPIKPEGSRPPLFLVHGAEGNVLLYRHLAEHMPTDQPVYGLQSEGLDGRTTFSPRIEDMAGKYIKEILLFQPEGPYRLGGYCMGGTVAFEMARQLTAQGHAVEFLGLLETYNLKAIPYPPPLPRRVWHKCQNVGFHLANLFSVGTKDKWHFFREKAAVEISRLRLSLCVTIARMSRAVGLKNALDFPYLRVDKANDRAEEEYAPGPYSGKITLFRPHRDFSGFDDYQMGWGELAAGGVETHELRNYPHGMLVEPFVRQLAKEMEACLNRA